MTRRVEHLRGVPFRDGPASQPRGLSWSDCAILFRSVARDSEPVVAELRRRGIPFIVKGLNRLFDSPEIQAVVGIFRFMVSEIDAASCLSRIRTVAWAASPYCKEGSV